MGSPRYDERALQPGHHAEGAHLQPEAGISEELAGVDQRRQRYLLSVPKAYKADLAWPLVVFVSPGDTPVGWRCWQKVCEGQGVLYCEAYGAGNNCPPGKRIHIALDMLDQVRHDYRVDPDQTYVSGFSGGGRLACTLGYSLPELFGGLARDDVPFPVPYPSSCSPQAWAAASPLLCLRTLLRLDPWLPHGKVWLNPVLPPGIDYLKVERIPLAGRGVTVEVADGRTKVEGLPPEVELIEQPRHPLTAA